MATSGIELRTLQDWLVGSRNADGGWAYYPSKKSRLEPTCWALLALRGCSSSDAWCRQALGGWPTANALLVERRDGTPNFAFHALALLTLGAYAIDHARGNASLYAAIQQIKGRRLEQSSALRQDNTLQAWPWIGETFSWLEPTAWCVLALKQRMKSVPRDVNRERVDSAERLILNRACAPGGWNYGNPHVFGRDLPAHIPTTALGVLAMQDRTTEPVLQRAADYLERDAVSEPSSVALALSCLALRALGRAVDHIHEALRQQLPTALELGSVLGVAMALCAMRTIATKEADAAFVL